MVSGTLGILMSIPGQTMGVSTFTDSLITDIGISRGDLSTAYLLGTVISAFFLTWVGKMYDIYGARPIAFAASICMMVILIYLSQVDKVMVYWFGADPSDYIKITFMFIGFLILRFSGQGALTMVSRNMMMKWFEQRRGVALGYSNIVVSVGFAAAPVFFEFLIQSYGWRMAWIILGSILGIGFSVYILFLFRDDPQDSDLAPDGDYTPSETVKKNFFPVIKEYTLPEARRTIAFWVFTGMLSIQALYVTGLTFNITSIFETSGLTRAEAINIFLPSSVVAVVTTLLISRIADVMKLKYLLYIKGIGGVMSLVGLITLDYFQWADYLLIIGNGFLMGLYSIVLSLTWPRYYGKTHLGAISGHAVTYIVVASAFGPKLFSWSMGYSGNYDLAGWICIGLFAVLIVLSFWANNPQEKYR